jgi:hypothetical protein
MHRIAFAAILSIFIASPVLAEGEIVITQAKALAGNVTPGDTAGFPVTISRPGAYVVASTLTVPAGSYGFQISSHNVDIDMNGFLLTGGGVGYYGLVSHYYGEGRIHGGTINGFRSYGIYVRNNAWVIEDMQIVRNGGAGIDATTRFIIVQNSLIATNGGDGIMVGNNSIIRNSTVSSNGNIGINCLGTCHVEGNAIDRNGSYGVRTSTGMIIGNTNSAGTEQIFGGVDLHPNACIGKPC